MMMMMMMMMMTDTISFFLLARVSAQSGCLAISYLIPTQINNNNKKIQLKRIIHFLY